ncbi:MAG: type IX secretion system anionic LPS delivery protein PorZ [Chitinophagaceae bacterium]
MRSLFIILFTCFSACLPAQQLTAPIGLWKEYLPYNSTIDVTAGNGKVFAATPYSVFSVTMADNSVERLSRVTGLSETGISAICYDNAQEKLFIAYSNSNIDILYRNDIINLPDIKRDNIIGDKTIYSIYPLEKNYYLSTGLGVVVIDGERYEVKDSWFIGNGGQQVKVNGFTSDATMFYAATEQGLKRAFRNAANLADHSQWEMLSGNNGLPAGDCRNVLIVQNNLIAEAENKLWIWNGNSWTVWYQDEWPIISATVAENKVLLCQRKANGESRVTILNSSAAVERVITQVEPLSSPRRAILLQNDTWLADQFGGLTHFTASSYEQYKPNSPEATASGEMTVYNNTFYATAGEVNEAWNYQYNGNGIYIFKEGEWTNINRYRYTQIDTLLDYITIAIDPKDESIWAGSFGGGLLHITQPLSFSITKAGVLSPAIGDPGSYRVSGLVFDKDKLLWLSNYGAPQPLLAKKQDGSWLKFSVPFLLPENALTQIISDDDNYKWIVAAKSGGLLCYDPGGSVENTGDDHWKKFGTGAGNGNLPAADVLCIAKDKDGFIWVGTANGIGVIQCPGQVFTGQGCEAVWPVVKQGNFAGYLFNGQQVRSIAVDGANRKWVATDNGVWLISATGEEVIYQFTETNSPLLSNIVKKITINGQTGEVFFATAKGICSFRSTATEGGARNENVLVFPNPIPPGYAGTIGIRGLANNAIVKITELDGRLVYQTRALGGQAVWDGKDYRGRRISTGVYLVLVSNDGRTENTAAKIVFISK